ncbi:peptide-methionine (R)-S-oxide reductase MsrB [Pseudomonas aestusnigri]|uniref:peptide-methionine (R)-S-oxide reductase MsrB n=1 Tax=Halopseudomonas aestusnigri TaxID=857252 RepID=UPI001D18A12A|nr:peptide-methionine (R)-S-oxide reductase MsrB [Halopseudomonas aestusnigri]MCC4260457.1 peptide-methionine (R)-S-oxide reductase MsrB [Halopseudomonas aestusnigri]
MKRRTLLSGLMAAPALPLLTANAQAADAFHESTVQALDLSPDYWRDKVSEAAWKVLVEEDTERPGSSPLDKLYDNGTYVCAACHLPLFSSEHKFDSGTGWPSFTQPIAGHMGTKQDYALIWPRTEYHCARCGGHQGHVFNDGPPPRGERWCNNGVALKFIAAGEPLPALRGDA